MSFGAQEYSKILEDAINEAYNNNILIFAAAGNKGMTTSGTSVDYPARFENVIAVGAVDRNGNRASFSSTGKELELMAPGVDIYSTLMNGNYGSASGTSAACPHAAGAAALVWSKYPQKTNAEVRKIMDSTASRLGDNALYGNGLLDVSAAMGISVPEVTPTATSTPAVTPLVNTGDRWIKLELDKDNAKVGDIITASLKINKIENCTGVQVNIKYDPEILLPVNPDTGAVIDKNSIPKGGDLFNDYEYVPFLGASNNIEKGYVSIGACYLNTIGFCSKTDTGTVASLGFKVLKENAARISIEDYLEYDSKIKGALIFNSTTGRLPEESYSIIQPSIINGHLPEFVKEETKINMSSTDMIMSTIGATTHTVSGYVDVDYTYSESVSNVIRQGFNIEVYQVQMINGTKTYTKIDGINAATTDGTGYFEMNFSLPIGTSEDIAFKISKASYLYRMVDASRYLSNMQLGTKAKPVLMWVGDFAINGVQDNVINMADQIELATAFNSQVGDIQYKSGLDLNKDNAINMADVIIFAMHSSSIPSNYPKQDVYLNQDIEVGALYDTVLINDNVVLNLNGRTMRVLGNLRNKGKIIVNNGVLRVDGGYAQNAEDVNAYLDLSNGMMTATGNVTIHSGTVYIDGGYMEMNEFYVGNQGVLQMTSDSDYIKVKGNMEFHSQLSHVNKLSAGTLELKDAFTINNNLGVNGGFKASGTHKVILSKESGTQYVNMSGDQNSKFNIVILTREFTSSNYSFNPTICYNNIIVLTGQVKGLNDGIHAPSGEYTKEFVDMTCDSPGFDVEFSRKYNSENTVVGSFGKGWTFGYDSSIKCVEYKDTSNNTISRYYEVAFPDGNKQKFAEINNGGTIVYQSVDSRNKLEKSGSNFVLTTKDQYKYLYAPKNNEYVLTNIYEKSGNFIQIGELSSGIRTITDGSGKTYTINYVSTTIDGTAYNLISKITDNTGTAEDTKRVLDYTYTNGKLTSVKDAVGNVVYYGYSSTTGLLEWIKAAQTGYSDFIEAIKYDSNNKMQYNTFASGYAKKYTYNVDNTNKTKIENITASVDSNGSITYGSTLSTTTLDYDSTLAIQKITVTKGTETYTSTTEYGGWSKYGEEKSKTDFNGNKTSYERDVRGNITKIINPDESKILYGYNESNDMIWELDEDGKYTLYVYNGGLLSRKARLLKKIKDTEISNYLVIDSSNEYMFSITQYDYYSYSSSPTTNPQLSNITNPSYNTYGLLASETQFMPSDNIVTEYRYYADGNLAWSKNPQTGNFTTYSNKSYSIKGWKVIKSSTIGHKSESYYNKNGQLYKEIKKPNTADKLSIKVTVYDSLGRKVQEVSPNLCALYYNSSTDTFSKQDIGTRFAYKGKSGVVNQVTDPLNNITTLLSDFNGNIISETKPNNAIYEYDYDGLNRLNRKSFKENVNATAQLLEQYTYSVEPATKYTLKTSKKYIDSSTSSDTITKSDYAGRIVYQKNPDNYETYTEYYKNGEVKKVTDPRGYNTYYKYGLYDSTTGWTYDEKWNAFMIVNGTTMYKYSKTMYDKAGRVKKQLFENDKNGVTYDEGANSSNGEGTRPTAFKETNYEYYKDGVVSNVQVVNGVTTQYTYDDDRNIKSEVVTIDTGRTLSTEYETNYLGKIEYKTTCVRKGDIYGNNFDTDNDNIYVSTRFDYDVEGNLKTTTGPLLRTIVNGENTYSNVDETFITTCYYDAMNRTTGVLQPGVDETGTPANIITTTAYNWEGKPIITTNANGDTTEYEYDKMGLLYRMKKGNEIVGVTDSGFTTTGTWTDGAIGGYRNGSLKYTSTSGCTANWSKTINQTDIYDVYVKCPEFQDGSTSATYQILNGTTILGTVAVNQYANRGNWVRLGRYIFSSNLEAKVILTTGGSKTYADAVKFENTNMNITAYKYDLAGRITAQVNPKDYIDGQSIDTMNRTVFTYDGMGRIQTTGFKGYEKRIDPTTTAWQSSPVAIDITTKSVIYDGNGNMIQETDGEGSSRFYKYSPSNLMEEILDPELKNDYPTLNNLYSRRFEYDTLGRKALESNIKGYQTGRYFINTWYQYDDTANTMLAKTAVNSNNIEAEAKQIAKEFYDYGGNLKSKMDANNLEKATGAKKVDYIFNNFNKTKSVTYPGDYEADVTGSTLPVRKVNYQYDYFGNVKKEFETYKMKVKTNVSTYTSITKVKDYSYDKQGRLLLKQEYQSDNKTGTLIQNSIKYDKAGNKRYETDGNFNTTQYSYDWFGRVINKSLSYTDSSVTPSRTVTLSNLYNYDANGNVTTETNKVADSTNSSLSTYGYDYDSQNRIIEKRDQGIVVQRLVYYNNSLQKSSYNAVNSATGTKLRLTSFIYDKNGKLKSTTDPVNTADSSYPDNHATSNRINTYDYAGNLFEVKDGNNSYTQYTYNVFDRLEELKNKDINEKYKYDYDSNGNMTKQTALYLTSGNYVAYKTMDYKYNDGNLLIQRKTQLGNTDNYSYYADGTIKEKTDRNAAKTSYVYDIHGRVELQKTEKTGSTTVDIGYVYDSNGNQLQVSDSTTGIIYRTYDALNRVRTKQVPNIGITNFKYDILSTRTEFAGLIAETSEYPANNTATNKTTKVYDKSKRLKYVVDGDSTGTIIATYTYNNDGSRRSLVYGNSYTEEYTYWDDGNLKSLTNKKADGTAMDIYQYQYDGAHNQIRKYEYINGTAKGTTIYGYDKMNRMNKVTEPSAKITDYIFDPAGNRKTETVTEGAKVTTNTYNYTTEDLLSRIDTVVKVNNVTTETHYNVYIYDLNGNQQTVSKDGILQKTYLYDLLNRMTTVKNSGGTVIATYSYDGEGFRVGKVEGTKTTRYLYEYDKVILEVDGSNNQVGRNIYGTNLLMRTMNDQVPAGQIFYYMYNGHGDVTAFLNRDTGKLAATYNYDAFGNIKNEQHYDISGNPTSVKYNNSILYAGYQYDKETGLYYLNARMYDPVTARFLQEDTYTGDPNDPLSLNLYTYCHNEPLMYTDPTGHWREGDEKYDNLVQLALMEQTDRWYKAKENNDIVEMQNAQKDAEKIRKEGLNNGKVKFIKSYLVDNYGNEGLNIMNRTDIINSNENYFEAFNDGKFTREEWTSARNIAIIKHKLIDLPEGTRNNMTYSIYKKGTTAPKEIYLGYTARELPVNDTEFDSWIFNGKYTDDISEIEMNVIRSKIVAGLSYAEALEYGGYISGQRDAADLMKYYLSKQGGIYYSDFMRMNEEDKFAKQYRKIAIDEAMEAAELLVSNTGNTSIVSMFDVKGPHTEITDFPSTNWGNGIGNYRTWSKIKVNATRGSDGTLNYNMSMFYNLRDNYMWYMEKEMNDPESWLHMLHIAGEAREFIVRGTEFISGVKWTK